jgi:hypothetical protein
MIKNSMSFVGLDLGDRQSHLIVLDPAGERVEETRLPTRRGALNAPRRRSVQLVNRWSRTTLPSRRGCPG